MKNVVMIGVLILGAVFSSKSALSNNYEVKKYNIEYVSNNAPDTPIYNADVYFSQNYFEHSSFDYDPHLASASLCLAVTTFTNYSDTYDDAWYQSQPYYVKKYFETLEFNSIAVNEDFLTSANIDTIGLCAAKREFNNYTLIGVVPRSGGYFREWASNMHLGDGSKSDYMHEGWYNAANKLINFVKDYITNNNVTGKIKLWMTGFSRGGATTNVAAGLLDNKLNNKEKVFGNSVTISREDIYAYTFEAPQGANVNSKTVKAPKDSLYNNIWNIVNPLDIVPKLTMKEYGFTRFGRDKYITNKFYNPSAYDDNRRTFNAFLNVFHQTPVWNLNPDSFEMCGFEIKNLGMDILVTLTSAIATDADMPTILYPFRDKTKVNYDANIAFNSLMGELVSNLGDRKNFVKKYQSNLENLMLIIQNEKNSGNISYMTLFLKILCISAIFDTTLNSPKVTKAAIQTIWGDKLATELYDALNKLTGPLSATYWEKPNELLSIAGYLSNIFYNHYPEVTLAHLAAQDSYYLDEYNSKVSNKLNLVPLFDNANYGRMHFFGYNDIGLRLDSKKGTRVININGHLIGKSDVDDCYDGYAAGYYSYATEEKMDLYMPINRKYNISMKSYSKKPYHRCEYWSYYTFLSLDNRGVSQVQVDHKKESTCFNSDRHKRDVNMSI